MIIGGIIIAVALLVLLITLFSAVYFNSPWRQSPRAWGWMEKRFNLRVKNKYRVIQETVLEDIGDDDGR